MVLKAVDMQWAALGATGDERKRRLLNRAIRYMRRSGFWFDDLSFVSSHLAGLANKFLNRPRITPRPFDVLRNFRTANFAGRYDRTVGVRSFGKLYGVRGLRLTFGTLHRDGIKLHVETPNVERNRDARLYCAAPVDGPVGPDAEE